MVANHSTGGVVSKDVGSEAELLEEIVARPDDDAPRAMLADLLTDRGDPRGELIALQLRRGLRPVSARHDAREKLLLDENWAAWVGPLAAYTYRAWAVFERGFLHAVTVTFDQDGGLRRVDRAEAPDWKGIVGHDAWRTVRSLKVYAGPREAIRGILFESPTLALRELILPSGAVLPDLVAAPRALPVERLTIGHIRGGVIVTEPLREEAVPELRFLELQELQMPVHEYRWLLGAPKVLNGLEELSLRGEGPIMDWLNALNPTRGPQQLSIVGLQFRRDGKRGLLSDLEVSFRSERRTAFRQSLERLEELDPSCLTRLKIEVSREVGKDRGLMQKLRQTVKRFQGLEKLELPGLSG
jgi:uncharacterized protein (TIGR02996 family)